LSSVEKINTALSAEFTRNKEVDFVVLLKNVDYTSMKHKNGKSFEELDIESKAHFIVETKIAHATETQQALVTFLQRSNQEFNKIWVINAIHIVKGSIELAHELASRTDVERIIYNQKYEISPMETSNPQTHQNNTRVEWNVDFVEAAPVWARGVNGRDIIVGVVDTGANFRHPSLFKNYVGNKNGTVNHDYAWFDPAQAIQEPRDTQDHGSHCTGTICGATDDRSYRTGISYESKWISCHFGGSFAAITRCFQFMLAPTDRRGNNPNPALRAHVTSHSYGGGGQARSLLEEVVRTVIDAGVHVVVAAHNMGRCRAVTDPGIIPEVLTVGALGFRTHNIAPFSSRGPNNAFYNNGLKPEISAPGTNVISASGTGVGYSSKSGTSMATPLVAGVIALIWSGVPALRRDIKKTNEILYETASKTPSTLCESRQPTPNNVYGHGTINARKAYERAVALYGNK